jgi:membrane-associated phospholipid phosphatase
MDPTDALPRPPEPRAHSLSPRGLAIAGWIALLIAGAIFFNLAWDVATSTEIVLLDAKVATWLHAHGSPRLTDFMILVTTLNSITGSSIMSLAFAIALARMREWYWLLTLALAVGGGMLLNVILKTAFARARPHFDDPWITLDSYSFPSGHTAGATLFYGVLAAFLVSRTNEWHARVALVVAAMLMVLMVAFSRMYLGAHYLSDVAAAACSSTVWLVLCLSTVHGMVRRRLGKK